MDIVKRRGGMMMNDKIRVQVYEETGDIDVIMGNKYKVFVYGTLRKGCSNHRLLEGADFIDNGIVIGNMYSVNENFPAFVRGGSDEIYGELYLVDDSILERLDRLERYSEEHEENSMYLRRLINVKMDTGETVIAIIYIWNMDYNRLKRIASGDWVEYKKLSTGIED